MKYFSQLLPNARKPGGLFQVLNIATPLILASAGHAMNLFFDRVMLARYSRDAVNAALPSGLTSFTICCFFLGVIGYANSFVAQYTGADAEHRVGPSIWQALWLSLLGGIILATGYFWAVPLFEAMGHAESVQEQEVIYFQILSVFSFIPLMQSALSAFWAGRGKTMFVMINNFIVTGLNIPLNYAFIFGYWGAPELGIAGAAIGTIGAALAGLLLYMIFFLLKKERRRYATWPPVFDKELFGRMLRYGTPSGVQLFLDLLAFNIFVIMLGWVGSSEEEKLVTQEASTIALSINSISFTPMIGLGQTVTVLVGQSVGAGKIADACRAVRTCRNLALIYTGTMALFFLFYPDPLIGLFTRSGDAGQVATMEVVRVFMRFIAALTMFDAMVIVFSGAVKGAGDTKFAMYANVGLAFILCVVPCVIAWFLKWSVNMYWLILDIYITTCAMVFIFRYIQGKWKKMRVIEDEYAKHAIEE